MASAQERKHALQSFMSTPQSMDACCNLLHLKIGSQVHKDIVRAIVQITGYGKQHVKADGLLEPRRVLADGKLSTKFNEPFAKMVENFLEKLKAGVLFFPVHLPHHVGWDMSFWPDDRLEWRSLVERDEIRGGILLMFEHIKNNGVTIDVTGAEAYQSFTTEDCDDCGSGVISQGDDIVYCNTCRVGHHQSCYGIYLIPKAEDPWYCNPCYASKEASAARKRRRAENPKQTTPKTRNVRFNRDDSDYSSILDSPRTATDIENANVLQQVTEPLRGRDLQHGKRHSSSIIQQKNGHSDSRTSACRVASQPVNLRPGSECLNSRKALASIPPSNANIQALNEERTPSPEPIMSHEQLEGTILLTRLNNENIFRPIPLSKIRTVDSLFKMCAQRWPEKFGAGRISRLLYTAKNDHVEIVGGSSADFRELLRMIKREWDIQGTQAVYIKIVLLAAGEGVEF